MGLEPAPFHSDVSLGSVTARAFWIRTSDNVRLRAGHWEVPGAKGTVLLFPGRTEYIEKYSKAACELGKRGFGTLSIDWRGQGHADRFLPDPRVGHVADFLDYQKDIAALLDLAEKRDLPRPWYLLAHSMGGCIGLRALIDGLSVEAAVFTGPMWGIRIPRHLQPVAFVLKRLLPALGLGHVAPPTTHPEPYVLKADFEDNLLTSDREMWDMMYRQIDTYPEIALGGPSILWLREALDECAKLAQTPSPQQPCLTFLGAGEQIVHVDRIADRMDRWPNGRLEIVPNARHEVLMESATLRTRLFDQIAEHFSP